ncbi:hypothetical protein STRDD10_00302 [Streptococcus sp. DD10]|nr:hypothetical protein [Streptococcus sp. DD10]KXT76239.1 hypothetical protein STRDD10_00302 [Streptococcus sp. DD10]
MKYLKWSVLILFAFLEVGLFFLNPMIAAVGLIVGFIAVKGLNKK